MNYVRIVVTMLLLCAVGCGKTPQMIIRGTAPAECEGLNVYLVPQPDPSPDEVDSTVVRDGRFELRIDAEPVRMCDITLSRRSPVPFERLLVAIEEGELTVALGEVSSGEGTPLNDELSRWKDRLARTGDRAMQLRMQIGACDDESKTDSLERLVDEAYAETDRYTVELIERNPNPLGGYLFMMVERSLAPDAVDRLRRAGIERWKPQRRKR